MNHISLVVSIVELLVQVSHVLQPSVGLLQHIQGLCVLPFLIGSSVTPKANALWVNLLKLLYHIFGWSVVKDLSK